VPLTAVTAAATSDPAKFQCRMYENKFPEQDELVMVKVKQIEDMGAYVVRACRCSLSTKRTPPL